MTFQDRVKRFMEFYGINLLQLADALPIRINEIAAVMLEDTDPSEELKRKFTDYVGRAGYCPKCGGCNTPGCCG